MNKMFCLFIITSALYADYKQFNQIKQVMALKTKTVNEQVDFSNQMISV